MLLPEKIKNFSEVCDKVIELQGHDTLFLFFNC
jgi:hypothetical protein